MIAMDTIDGKRNMASQRVSGGVPENLLDV
jgi:hypothetical protein